MAKEKSKKKKLPVVEFLSANYAPGEGMVFSLASSPANGRKQAFSFASCRDQLLATVRSHITGGSHSTSAYEYGKNPEPDMDKMRLLVARSTMAESAEKTYKDKLFSGKKVLNHYEKLAGWDLSKITTVKWKDGNCWLVTGPKEWILSAPLLSMAALILRVSTKVGPIEFKDEKSLQAWFADKVKNFPNALGSGDTAYIKECAPKFQFVVEQCAKIFPEDPKDNWIADSKIEKGAYFNGNSGIYALCGPERKFVDKEIKARFLDLWNKWRKKE